MKLEVGCLFEYLAEGETPAVAIVEPHSSLGGALLAMRWEPQPHERYEDLYGNICRRLELPPGASSFAYHGTVEVAPDPEQLPRDDELLSRIEQLPSPLLHWLLPSRFCASDELVERAWALFGATPPTAARVQAICAWIHGSIEYGVPTLPTTTASEVLARGSGMCRDFAHLGVSFCRALGIPARYVAGYLPDLGIAGPFPTMDFHAWFEAWLGCSLVDVRRAFQRAADRSCGGRAWARRRGRRDGHDLRSGEPAADDRVGRARA